MSPTSARPRAAAAQAVGAEHVEIEFREADFWRLTARNRLCRRRPGRRLRDAADLAAGPRRRARPGSRSSCRARAATSCSAAMAAIAACCGRGGPAGGGRARAACSTIWACCAARSPAGAMASRRPKCMRQSRGRTSLQVAQAVDCADWLPNDLLTKLDRCLMAHGVEGRTPFLDPELAALAFRLPDELKIRRGLGKWLLRRWLAEQLPQAQPLARKRGFTVPVARWIARARRDDRPAGRALAGGARAVPARGGRNPVRRRRAKARRPRRLEPAVLRAVAPPSHRARPVAPRYRGSAGGNRVNSSV